MFLFPAVSMIVDLKLGKSSDQRDCRCEKRIDNPKKKEKKEREGRREKDKEKDVS